MPIFMGKNSYGNPVVSGNMNNIYVGNFCSIADSVLFDGGMQHNHRFVTTYPLWLIGAKENRAGMCKGDIHVGNDVWIGDGAFIMSGVTIGDGAVIGACAVVTKDVESYAVVGGVPAVILKRRFGGFMTSRLLNLKWWDWPKEKILENADLMLSENIEAFLEKHGA